MAPRTCALALVSLFATAVALAQGAVAPSLRPPAPARAAPVSTPWAERLSPVADTWLWRTVVGTPAAPQVHGAETSLVTGIDDTRGVQVALVRFDVSAMRWAAPYLQHAELYLTMTDESHSGAPYHATRVYLAETAWDEATTADEAALTYGAELDSEVADPNAETRFDVTAAVAGWLDGAPSHGVALLTTQDLVFTRTFASREAAAGRPRLEVWFMPPMVPPGSHTPTATITALPGYPTDPFTQTTTTTPTPTRRTPTAPPPTATPGPLPDLSGSAVALCQGDLLQVTVRNAAPGDAGPFRVRAAGEAQPVWRVPGLPAGAELRLAPQRGRASVVLVDADDEVAESDEGNNEVVVLAPRCLPLYVPHASRSAR